MVWLAAELAAVVLLAWSRDVSATASLVTVLVFDSAWALRLDSAWLACQRARSASLPASNLASRRLLSQRTMKMPARMTMISSAMLP